MSLEMSPGASKNASQALPREDSLRQSDLIGLSSDLSTLDFNLLHSFYDSLPVLMGIVELRGDALIFRSCNEATLRFLGVPRENIIGRSAVELGAAPEQQDYFVERYRLSEQSGSPIRFEYSGQWQSKTCWLAVTGCYLGKMPSQNPCFSYMAEDISARKENERALRRANKRIVNILDSITDAFFALDREWRFTYVNPVAEKMLRHPRHELLGHVLWERLPCTSNTRFPEELQRAVNNQVAVSFETTVHRVGFHIAAYPSQDGLSVYANDISQHRSSEEEAANNVVKLQRNLDGVVRAMSFSVEIRDPYTAGHQRRVSVLASGIARQLSWSPTRIQGIKTAALLHDLGKIAVPAEILSRPGKLSAAERTIIQTHPQVGYDILQRIEFAEPVALVALQHHERLDGSGYPAGLQGEAIIPEARLLAVADVVEAMASHRPYRPALGIERALEEILKQQGILYDSEVVDACFELLRENGFDLEHLMEQDATRERQ